MTVQPLSSVLGRDHPTNARRFEPSDVVTSQSLLEDIRALFDELDEARENTQARARECVEAEYAYELAFTTSRVTLEGGEGSVGFKDAKATQAAAEKKREWGYAKELLKSARRAEEVVSQKLSAIQTVAANAREEMKLAGRLEPSDRTG